MQGVPCQAVSSPEEAFCQLTVGCCPDSGCDTLPLNPVTSACRADYIAASPLLPSCGISKSDIEAEVALWLELGNKVIANLGLPPLEQLADGDKCARLPARPSACACLLAPMPTISPSLAADRPLHSNACLSIALSAWALVSCPPTCPPACTGCHCGHPS